MSNDRRDLNPLAAGLLRVVFSRGDDRKRFAKQAAGDFFGAFLTMAGQHVSDSANAPDDDDDESEG